MSLHVRLRTAGMALSHAVFLTIALLPAKPSFAQQDALQPGEAYVTRFSGREARHRRRGDRHRRHRRQHHRCALPAQTAARASIGSTSRRRKPVTASQVGQVFGVTLDDANPPNVYLTATSAFGLHRTGNNWMPGMWGPGGGPGAIYRLDASTGYAPRVFAQITLNGRPNSGAALGNIAYDRINKQLFVSDLETGMIHRIRAADGGDLGFYDHGIQGRNEFHEGRRRSAARACRRSRSIPIRARASRIVSGRFDYSPQCWNFAATGRRVWGLGVRRDVDAQRIATLLRGVASPDFEQPVWNQEGDDEKRKSVWSVRLGPNGGFD